MKLRYLMALLGAAIAMIAGAIIYKSFFLGREISDLIAFVAVLVTFLFAYNGFRHNEKVYMSSVRPVIVKLSAIHGRNLTYTLSIQNCGTGPALNMKYKVNYEGRTLSHEEFTPILEEFCRRHAIEGEHAGRLGMSPNTEMTVLKLQCSDAVTFNELKQFLSNVELIIGYESVQGKQFTTNIELSDGI